MSRISKLKSYRSSDDLTCTNSDDSFDATDDKYTPRYPYYKEYPSSSPRSDSYSYGLYYRSNAAQKKLEHMLVDETSSKLKYLKEIGKISHHLIAENQQLHYYGKRWQNAFLEIKQHLHNLSKDNRLLEERLYDKRVKLSRKYALRFHSLQEVMRNLSQQLQEADERLVQMDRMKSYYRNGYKDAYKAYYSEYQSALRLKDRISMMLAHLADIKKREKAKNIKIHYIANKLDKLAHEDIVRKSYY